MLRPFFQGNSQKVTPLQKPASLASVQVGLEFLSRHLEQHSIASTFRLRILRTPFLIREKDFFQEKWACLPEFL